MKGLPYLCAALLAWNAIPAWCQDDPKIKQVVRREDRRGLVIVFTTPVSGANAPTDVRRFVLMDLTSQSAVPLDASSVVTPEGCPQITSMVAGRRVGPRDRLCLELRPEAPALDDRHSYVLLTDTVRLAPTGSVPPVTLRIDPVAGAVAPIKEETNRIEVTFSRELAGDASIQPAVKVNGRPARIETSGQVPRCYNVGSLSFQCTLGQRLRNGDVVEVDLVRTDGQSAGYGVIEKSTVTATLPEKADQVKRFLLSIALSRLDEETNGTLTAKTAGGIFRRIGRVGDAAYLELAPHADILVTSKTDGSGRLSAGPQIRLNTFVVPGLDLTSVQATPRFESDDKNVRHNWMYLDVEAVLYIRPLYKGTLLRGSRQIFPRVGYERGTTGRGGDTISVEANDPSRWTAGGSLVLHWAEGDIPLFPAGLDITADYDRVWIQRNPLYTNPPTASPSYWTASATMRVAKNFGLTLTRRSGRRPPLFRFQSGLDVGASFLY